MENTDKSSPKWRWGIWRWVIILIIIGNVLAIRAVNPIMPHVQVPAEHISGPYQLPVLGEIYFTNTMFALLIADVLLLLIALRVRLATRGDELVLSGFPAAVEAIVEAIYGLIESTAGKWAKRILPWMATIILLLLVVNLMELLPGVDSIGTFHEPHAPLPAYETETLFTIGDFPVSTITEEVHLEEMGGDASHTEAAEGEHSEEGSHEEHYPEGVVGFTPWVRVTSTDLNFTVGLALVSVFMTQVIGVQALGLGYFSKFFQFKNFAKMWAQPKLGPFDVLMPFIDIFVGLLELIAEIAKIISFAFRLFGNIFAGMVLLFVVGSLVPVFVQSGVLLLEFMVGLIQALVFGMLTMVFMTMATQGHDDHDEEH
ncbi:MAG: F0F1 ATP synthase subunit A [Anaerolineales bacterium]